VLRTVVQQLAERHIFLLAGGIAFNVAVCFLPLGLLALWLFAGVVPMEVVEEAVSRVLILPLLPSERMQQLVEALMEQLELAVQRRSIVGLVGLVSLLWTASALLQSVRTGLHAAFRLPMVRRRGHFLWGRLRDVVLTVVLLGLTLPLSVVLVGWGILMAWGADLLPSFWRGIVRQIAGAVASILLEVGLFGFVFRYVPMVRLPNQVVAYAVGSAVVLTEILRVGFVWYLEHLAPWGWIYGGYAAVVSLAVWAYGVAFILLLSGVISSVLVQR